MLKSTFDSKIKVCVFRRWMGSVSHLLSVRLMVWLLQGTPGKFNSPLPLDSLFALTAKVVEVKDETFVLQFTSNFVSHFCLCIEQRLYYPAHIRTLSEGCVEITTASVETNTWCLMGRWPGIWTNLEKAGGSLTDRLPDWRVSSFHTQSTGSTNHSCTPTFFSFYNQLVGKFCTKINLTEVIMQNGQKFQSPHVQSW